VKEGHTITELLKKRYDFNQANVTNLGCYEEYGLVLYFIKQVAIFVKREFGSRDLSADDRPIIDEFDNIHSWLQQFNKTDSTLFISNRNKNLIFIVVESLNGWALSYDIYGRKVMPFLSSICDESSNVLWTDKMLSQVHSGISSDGQFIYNTGLYSASDVTTVAYYLENDLPSLPRVFADRFSFEVICEKPTMWYHDESNKAYGYSKLISQTDLIASKECISRDEAMFNTALETMDTIPGAFFSFLITMTMHAPFEDSNVSMPDWIENQPNLSSDMKKYLTVCNGFDCALHKFFNDLKDRHIYENSIIILASDHTIPVSGSGYDSNYSDIVFAMFNSGLKGKCQNPIGQVDIYPTILNVMDRYCESEYSGMGLSILNEKNKGAIDRNNNIYGDSISPEYYRMLGLAQKAANLKHIDNKY